MLSRALQKFFFLLVLMFMFSHTVSADYGVCDVTMDISGLPTNAVGVTPGESVTWEVTVTGAVDHEARFFEVDFINHASLLKYGSVETSWIEDTISGHVGTVEITYTPNDTFVPNLADEFKFRILESYKGCVSDTRSVDLYHASCNGRMTGSDSWSYAYITWGATKTNLYTYMNSEHDLVEPQYTMVLADDSTNLATIEHIDTIDWGTTGKRMQYSVTHAEISSGWHTVKFRVEDNAIDDAAAREACAVEFSMPVYLYAQPANYYCDGLGLDFEVDPTTIDLGETATITVQGVPGDNSSGEYTYEITSTLSHGTIPPAQLALTPATEGGHTYVYTHDGGLDGADTLTVIVRDAEHDECSRAYEIPINIVEHCASIEVTASDVDPINAGAITSFTVNITGGINNYRYRIAGGVNNGTITSATDSGWIASNSFSFTYEHDIDANVGDIIAVEVEADVADTDLNCTYNVNVPIQLINYCEDFGVGDGSTLTLTIDPGDAAIATIFGDAGVRGSGQFIYNLEVPPSHGEITSAHNSGPTLAESFDFHYQHDGSEFTDNFVVSVQDAEHEECIEQVTVYVEFTDYCETFSGSVSPTYQNISIGGSYNFTASGNGGSGQYRYSIVTLPTHGEITSNTVADTTGGASYIFTYEHDPDHPNDGDVIQVVVEDTEYECSTDPINVTMNMGSNCSSLTYSINNPYTGTYLPRGINEVIRIDITVTGGSGDYSFNTTSYYNYSNYYNGTLTDAGETVDGDTYIKHFDYVQTSERRERFRIRVTDNVYENAYGSNCKSAWLDSRYDFNGEEGNDACHALNIYPTGTSTAFDSNVGDIVEFTMHASGYDPEREYEFYISSMPSIGGMLVATGAGDEPNTMNYRYTAPDNTLGSDRFVVSFRDVNDALCSEEIEEFESRVDDESDDCNGNTSGARGDVVIDNTGSSVAAISTNLKFLSGCTRAESTIGEKSSGSLDERGQGANIINISDYQIVARNPDPDRLNLYVGAQHGDGVVESRKLLNASQRLNYFANGDHLFNLNDLRDAADWLSGETDGTPNVETRDTADDDLVALDEGTYGTITMQKFLENIRDGKVMYGVVRVLIGLEKGVCEDDCDESVYNGLGLATTQENIYGFCDGDNDHDLCQCAPSNREDLTAENHFPSIKTGEELCDDSAGEPIVLPENAKIMIKGSLLWDFVYYDDTVYSEDSDDTGVDDGVYPTIPLGELPFDPAELYFKVEVPVVVNSAYDEDYCGGENYSACGGLSISSQFVGQVQDINSITSIYSETGVISPIGLEFSKVPAASKRLYQAMHGGELTETVYNNLPVADQYHLLMPSGYAAGWEDAFKQLEVTAEEWQGLGFTIPPGTVLTEPLTYENIVDNDNDDVPVYLYSGGLVDMHSHVNISGLVYVPQALELEAVAGPDIRQMIMGAVVVKDGFFIQALNDSITIFSNDSSSYSSIRTDNPIVHKRTYVGSGLEGLEYDGYLETDPDTGTVISRVVTKEDCDGCDVTVSGNIDPDDETAPRRLWQQIIPR